jgi:hypothetical protein
LRETLSSENEIMSTESFKSHVETMLGLPPNLSNAWDILELYPEDRPQLVLVHYNENYEPNNRSHLPLKKIRGTILDLETGAIVCDSYGHTQTLPCFSHLVEEFPTDMPSGQIVIDTEITEYINDSRLAPNEAPKYPPGTRIFDSHRTRMFIGYEGAVLRIFKWKGQVFVSTHRRINAYESHWGSREKFIDIYRRLGGPEPESFFGEEDYSPYCHLVLVVDNQIRLASSTRDNRIIYLGFKKVWSEEEHAQIVVKDGQGTLAPYSHFKDIKVRYPKFGHLEEPSAFSTNFDRPMIDQPSISVELANKFMFPSQFATNIPDNGYPVEANELVVEYEHSPVGSSVKDIYFPRGNQDASDRRLRGGDFIILYYLEDNGETTVYRLEPETFQYRAKVMDDNPNLYNRFIVKMPEFAKADKQTLANEYPRFEGEDGKDLQLDDMTARQVYWWSILCDAAAPFYRQQIDGFWDNYQRDINTLARFIISDYPKITDPEEMKRINENTQKRFTDLRNIATNGARAQKRAPDAILRHLLYTETGPSVYKMISSYKAILKYRQRLPTEASVASEITVEQPAISVA